MKMLGGTHTVGRSVGRSVDHPHASMTNERNEHALLAPLKDFTPACSSAVNFYLFGQTEVERIEVCSRQDVSFNPRSVQREKPCASLKIDSISSVDWVARTTRKS